MKTASIAAPLLLAASLIACNKAETPAETQKDVAEARSEGRADIAEAQREQAENATNQAAGVSAGDNPLGAGTPNAPMTQADRETAADKAHEVEKAKAVAAYQVASEKCDALTGAEKGRCLKVAEDDRKAAEAMADSNRMKMREGDAMPIAPAP